MRPLAFVAIRVDGAAPCGGDLLEIAVARAEPTEAHPTDVYTTLVRPMREIPASPVDADAVWLVDAMDHVRALTAGCTLVAWDAGATRAVLDMLVSRWQLLPLELTPRSLDLRSMAWPLTHDIADGTLASTCAALHIEPPPSDGSMLDEVRALTELYRRVVKPLPATADFSDDERAILDRIAERIASGRHVYGPWRVDDGRRYPREALAEIMDALNYCAAELVRLSKGGDA